MFRPLPSPLRAWLLRVRTVLSTRLRLRGETLVGMGRGLFRRLFLRLPLGRVGPRRGLFRRLPLLFRFPLLPRRLLPRRLLPRWLRLFRRLPPRLRPPLLLLLLLLPLLLLTRCPAQVQPHPVLRLEGPSCSDRPQSLSVLPHPRRPNRVPLRPQKVRVCLLLACSALVVVRCTARLVPLNCLVPQSVPLRPQWVLNDLGVVLKVCLQCLTSPLQPFPPHRWPLWCILSCLGTLRVEVLRVVKRNMTHRSSHTPPCTPAPYWAWPSWSSSPDDESGSSDETECS